MSKPEVIDKGKIVIEDEKDITVAARFLKALADGDETYKPKGLKQLSKNNSSKKQDHKVVIDPKYEDFQKNSINFI